MSDVLALQMYSLRDYVDNEISRTFFRVRETGFSAIETAGFYGISSSKLSQILEKEGLYAYSAHISLDEMETVPDQVLEDALALGLSYVVCPSGRIDTVEDIKRTAEVLNILQEKLLPYNIHLAYHNHDREFEKLDGKYKEDILLGYFAFPEMRLELDTCWLQYAGVDPLDYIGETIERKRLGPVHFKDLGEDKQVDIALGSGIIDFQKILEKHVLDRGIIVEQEAFLRDPFTVLEETLGYLHSIWPKNRK